MTGDTSPAFSIAPKWRNKNVYFSLSDALLFRIISVYLYQIKGGDPGKAATAMRKVTDRETTKVVDFEGMKVSIPKGYIMTEDGTFMNGHGVEYGLVVYGAGECITVCLETIYSKHVRTVEVECV